MSLISVLETTNCCKLTNFLHSWVIEENPYFHFGMEEKCCVVLSIITDDSDQMELSRYSPFCVHHGIEHLITYSTLILIWCTFRVKHGIEHLITYSTLILIWCTFRVKHGIEHLITYSTLIIWCTFRVKHGIEHLMTYSTLIIWCTFRVHHRIEQLIT